MRGNYKLHAIAISIISAVIIVLYLFMRPAPVAAPDNAVKGDRFIEIYSASWGENCNPAIAALARQQQSQPVQKDASGQLIKPPEFKPVAPNNVLQTVSDHCNGKLVCTLDATSTAFGMEPLASCFKRLRVSFRCFSYDRLWTHDIAQGQPLAIDCNAPADFTSK